MQILYSLAMLCNYKEVLICGCCYEKYAILFSNEDLHLQCNVHDSVFDIIYLNCLYGFQSSDFINVFS